MSSEPTIRPVLQKGGLAVYESVETLKNTPKIIVFQYNPEQLKRTLTARAARPKSSNMGGSKEDVMRAMGPPVEAITISISTTIICFNRN